MGPPSVGIDFGTTNSAIARFTPAAEVQLAQFPYLGHVTDVYRSLLYLEQIKEHGRAMLKSWTGPFGIERYLGAETKGRLIQSLKSFLSSRSLQTTNVFGRRCSFEDLVARILRDLREKAQDQFGIEIRACVVGRPVRFVGAETDEDNSYAVNRLESALRAAGFESIIFELEPVAAAYYYESTLDHDELILIGDFGGGTSDFSLINVGPTIRRRGRRTEDLVGNAGVGVAGDAFDAKIIRNVVSPALGAGTQIRSGNKILPVPSWVYTNLERWHHLSFLRASDTMNMLRSIQAQALEPQKIAALIHLVKEDLGFFLHRSVQEVKSELSRSSLAHFSFSDGTIEISSPVTRSSFEQWIADELRQIENCVESLFHHASVAYNNVDMVFLTGGSSFVPAVRRIFEARFGRDRIRSGSEFTSVARGLAIKAADLSAP